MTKSILLIFLLFSIVTIEAKPLYELGVGYIGFDSPHYPGSKQSDYSSIALPLVIYRGEYFSADQEGLKKDISQNYWYKLDFSMAGAFPARSEDNEARKGMSDLDLLVEIGPSFEIHLHKNTLTNLDLRFQMRTIFSSDFPSITFRGFAGHVMLYYEKRELFSKNLTLFSRLGSVFGSEKIMDYFYEVSPKDVTAQRELYDAKAGYIESHLDLGLSYIPNNYSNYYVAIQKNFYNGTTNQRSPLHTAKEGFGIGFGITWAFYKSSLQAKE